MFGGVARLQRPDSRDATTELRIALARPATSVVIGVACLTTAAIGAALHAPDVVTAGVGWLGVLNILLAVFNMLPGAPLDGGRVLTAILWRRSRDERRARKRAAHAGQVVGQVLTRSASSRSPSAPASAACGWRSSAGSSPPPPTPKHDEPRWPQGSRASGSPT